MEDENRNSIVTGAITFLTNTKRFIWNRQEKTVLGRNAQSWGRIGIFYLLFFFCLGGVWFVMFSVFNLTIQEDNPKLQDKASSLRQNPGLGVRPLPDDNKIVHYSFEAGKPITYKMYQSSLELFLHSYDDEYQKNHLQCDHNTKLQHDQVCAFNVSSHFNFGATSPGCTADTEYGYKDGQPCIILKLNRIFNWVPELFDNKATLSHLKDVPKKLQKDFDKHAPLISGTNYTAHVVPVTCSAEFENKTAYDLKYQIFGKGFPKQYYPFHNQKGYLSPFVWCQFMNLPKGQVLIIWCRAWAKNIVNLDLDSKSVIRGAALIKMIMY